MGLVFKFALSDKNIMWHLWNNSHIALYHATSSFVFVQALGNHKKSLIPNHCVEFTKGLSCVGFITLLNDVGPLHIIVGYWELS